MFKSNLNEVKDFLESKFLQYNNPVFVESDPISIPHLFNKKEDIEISAFLSATIAWGQRKTIINNANKLMKLMDYAPHDFIANSKNNDYKPFKKFVHRTFNSEDLIYFFKSLQHIYLNHSGLESVFAKKIKEKEDVKSAIIYFRKVF